MSLRRAARNTVGALAGAVALVVVIDGYVDSIDPVMNKDANTVAAALAGAASPAGGDSGGSDAAMDADKDILTLISEADPADGAKVTKVCAACHTFEDGGPNRVGPNLHDVVGHPKGTKSDFAYSDAMMSSEGPWSYEALDAFLTNPRDAVPGTKMAFKGLSDKVQRAQAIAYLRSLTPSPPPLNPPAAEAEATPDEEAAPAEDAAPTNETAPTEDAAPTEEAGPTDEAAPADGDSTAQ